MLNKFVGREIAIVENKKNNNDGVYVLADKKKHKIECFDDLKLNKHEFKMAVDPLDRAHYFAGPPGSGKSFLVCRYAKSYMKKYPKNKVYLFSEKETDETIDQCKGIKRIQLDESLVEDPLNWEELHDSLVIFDDVDSISDKSIKKELAHLANKILMLGRDRNIFIIVTNHNLTNANSTRDILNNCNTITYFPHACSAKSVLYLVENYANGNKRDVLRIKATHSRWCTIFKNYPPVILTDKEVWTPN